MILDVRNLYVKARHSRGTASIVSGLSFRVNEGDKLAIVGESGCGKTMTATAILGLLPANCFSEGEIIFQSRDINRLSERKLAKLRGSSIALMPQSGAEYLNPSLRVRTQICECLKKNGFKDKNELNRRAYRLLASTGLNSPEKILEKFPFQLSGGEAQRVVMAVTMCSQPKLIIADEPTKGIDGNTAQNFFNMTKNLSPDCAVIIITHNIKEAAEVCNRLAVMYKGELVEYGQTDKVLEHPRHPYTQSLIDALPENGFKILREKHAPTGKGCAFEPRCPKATEECRLFSPALNSTADAACRCFNAESL